MSKHLKLASAVAVRSLPLIVGAVLSTTHPALALNTLGGGSTALSGISTGTTAVEGAMQFVGMGGAVIGIALGGIHWVQHRDDLFGSAQRVLSGVIAGFVVSNAPQIASLSTGGSGVLF